MSSVALSGNASGTGAFVIASPNSNSNRTLTLPDATTTLVGADATQTLTNKTLTSPTITGAVVSSMASSVITSGTVQASTSGTNIDFTGIPSWVKRITVNLTGVSLSSTANIVFQIGSSGTPKSSGYLGAYVTNTSAPAVSVIALSAGFVFASSGNAALHNGSIVISLLDSATNTWSALGVGGESSGGRVTSVGGSVALSGTLNIVRVTSSSTDTFDAGSINILYE